MSNDRVVVYSSGEAYKIELIKNILSDHDIVAFSINKQDSSYLFGEIEIYVKKDDVIRAKRLIDKFES